MASDLHSIQSEAKFERPRQEYLEESFALVGRYRQFIDGNPEPRALLLNLTTKDIMANLQQIIRCSTSTEIKKLFHARQLGWNVSNLKEAGKAEEMKGTIEFRRPPASLMWEDALCWIELIFSFIFTACDDGTVEEAQETYPRNMAMFSKWLKKNRFSPELVVGKMLDSKFKHAKEISMTYFDGTTKREEELKKNRKEFKGKTPLNPKLVTTAKQRQARFGRETPEQEKLWASLTAKEMDESKKVELKYVNEKLKKVKSDEKLFQRMKEDIEKLVQNAEQLQPPNDEQKVDE